MLNGKALFLIAILSLVATSDAFAYCSVVRRSPIVNDQGQRIGSISSGCFAAFGWDGSGYWRWGYVPDFGGNASERGWVWANSIDCQSSCHTFR
jgi:hypothetical protein